jgi:predicted RNA-binding protein associated with RNAse of E/G family
VLHRHAWQPAWCVQRPRRGEAVAARPPSDRRAGSRRPGDSPPGDRPARHQAGPAPGTGVAGPSITEIKTTLDGRVDRFVCDLVDRSPRQLVVRSLVRQGRWVHGVWLPAGTVTIGYFWTDRPFNLYHWLDPQGRTLAYYFNVGDVTGLSGAILEWRDLAVDVLATPDGRVEVLDEDELPADLDPAIRRRVEAARDHVLGNLAALMRQAEHHSAAYLDRLARQEPGQDPAADPRTGP